MAHGPGSPSTVRQLRGMAPGAAYMTPADAQKASAGNVPPPHLQPPQLSHAVPSSEWTPSYKASMSGGHDPAPAVHRALSTLSGRDPGGVSRTNPADGGGATSSNALGGFMGMLAALLGRSATSQLTDPSLADAFAAPSAALGKTIQDQLSQLPDAKAQALANIANWYGQVSKDAATAGQRNQDMANAGSSSIQDATKGIMASLGGAANAASGQIGAVGANDAATMKAIGASDSQLANDLGPIFDLAKSAASNQAQGKYDAAKTYLQDQFAQASGQATADKTQALMAILDSNNKARQGNFANEAGLLNTLAGLQISGANAATKSQAQAIENALRISEINKNNAKSQGGGWDAMSPYQKADFVDKIKQGLMDPNTGKLKTGIAWPQALRDVRGTIRSAGMNPLDPSIISQIVQPALAGVGINFANPQALYQP
ncbi:MAG: hypothetical protein KGL39_15095 [Patescibacteria group bacterium]|nr:hypothetical protein [Patescibacteria group bacterium]